MENLRLLIEAHLVAETPDDTTLSGMQGRARLTLGDLKEVYALAKIGQESLNPPTPPEPDAEAAGHTSRHRAPSGARRTVA